MTRWSGVVTVLGEPVVDAVAHVQSGDRRGFWAVDEAVLVETIEARLRRDPVVSLCPGGSSANFAASLARSALAKGERWRIVLAGRRTAVPFADVDAALDLRLLGVDVRAMGDAVVAASLCLVDEHGRTVSVTYPDPPTERPAGPVEGACAGLLSRIRLLPVTELHGDVIVQLDDDLSPVHVRDWVEAIAPALPGRVLVIGTASRASKLLEGRVPDGVTVVATRGSGFVSCRGAGSEAELAVEEAEVVTDLGAGDAYAGGFAYAWLSGANWNVAHGLGQERAAGCLRAHGARPLADPPLTAVIGALTHRSVGDGAWPPVAENLHRGVGPKFISGGQSGVDEAGLEVAGSLGWPTIAVMPAGKRREGGSAVGTSIGALELEYPSPSYRFRTWANAWYGDITLLFDEAMSEGSAATVDACAEFGRPVVDGLRGTPGDVARLMEAHAPSVINVAGTRGSRIADADALNARVRAVLLAFGLAPAAAACRTALDRVAGLGEGASGRRLTVAVSDRGVPPDLVRALFPEADEAFFGRCLSFDGRDLTLHRLRPTDVAKAWSLGDVDVVIAVDDVLPQPCFEVDRSLSTRLSPVGFGVAWDGARRAGVGGLIAQHPEQRHRWAQRGWPVFEVSGKAEAWARLRPDHAVADSMTTGRTAWENGLTHQRVDHVSHLRVAWTDQSEQEAAGALAGLLRRTNEVIS